MADRSLTSAALGAATIAGFQALLPKLLLIKFRRDVRALNAGDYKPLLSGYAPDAVIRFNEGTHRWAGEHRGKAAIERFLQEFVRAGIQGEIREIRAAGPPWALVVFARFDDWAKGAGGEEIYRNRVQMRIETRWGRVVHHEDFYEDTGRIERFEAKLREDGVHPLP